MDIIAGITVAGAVAVVSLVLGLRAEARAHAERKHGDAAKMALACHSISEVLREGMAVTVADPAVLQRTQENQSTFTTLSARARQAISPVAVAFPESVIELEELGLDAEQLATLHSVPREGDTAYAAVVDRYYHLYHNLLLLSYVAFRRHGLVRKGQPPADVLQDQFVQAFKGRYQAFRRERFSVRGLVPPP